MQERDKIHIQLAGQIAAGILANEQCAPLGISFRTYGEAKTVANLAVEIADHIIDILDPLPKEEQPDAHT